jgi:hypothetical protein
MSKPYSFNAETSFGFHRSGLPVTEAVTRVARRLWPIKTARHLSSRAGVTHRAAEFWMSESTGMSADALAELLRSDAGFDVLDAMMGDARPSWWPAFVTAARLDDLDRRNEEARKELEALRNELTP